MVKMDNITSEVDMLFLGFLLTLYIHSMQIKKHRIAEKIIDSCPNREHTNEPTAPLEEALSYNYEAYINQLVKKESIKFKCVEINEAYVPGNIIEKKYQIIREISIGNMSNVYLVKNLQLNNNWIMKVIKIKDNKQLLSEEAILSNLNHVGIPKIVDLYYRDQLTIIIEEYIIGTTLREIIDCKDKFPIEMIQKWSLQICDLLNYLHNLAPSSVIYVDLKPSNIIITPDNIVSIIDFGIARIKKERPVLLAYTSEYLDYEQCRDKYLDETIDYYSFGVILCELMNGGRVNNRSDNRNLFRSNRKLLTIAHKCLKFQYNDIREIKKELLEI